MIQCVTIIRNARQASISQKSRRLLAQSPCLPTDWAMFAGFNSYYHSSQIFAMNRDRWAHTIYQTLASLRLMRVTQWTLNGPTDRYLRETCVSRMCIKQILCVHALRSLWICLIWWICEVYNKHCVRKTYSFERKLTWMRERGCAQLFGVIKSRLLITSQNKMMDD